MWLPLRAKPSPLSLCLAWPLLCSGSPTCDLLELQRRYRSLQVPGTFLAVHLSWLSAFPLSQPFSLHHPSRIQVSAEKEPAPGAEPSPADSDPAYSSKVSRPEARAPRCRHPGAEPRSLQVLLLSSPGLEELYRCCLLFVDDMAEPRDTPEHPLKQIKVVAGAACAPQRCTGFGREQQARWGPLGRPPTGCCSPRPVQFLLGQKDEEAVLVGGEWSPSLDGLDPKGDPQVLVRTAIRCAQAQTGIDLGACTKW